MTENKEIENMTEAKKEVKLPKYMVCEHTLEMFEKQVSIFNLNLEELVFEKMFLMFERLVPANADLENSEIKLKTETDKILLETDFKSMGLTNEKMRQAHIKKETNKFQDTIKENKTKVEFYRNKLTIINDLIKVRRLELKIETSLNEDD